MTIVWCKLRRGWGRSPTVKEYLKMSEAQKEHEVRIHVDRKPYGSPNPTTHAALYTLGKVQSGYELFKEVQGDHEDEAIPNDAGPIHLNQDEHFYSAQATLNPGAA